MSVLLLLIPETSMSSTPAPLPDHQQLAHPWRRSGTWMVVIMFAFAFAMIGLMYMYWELHTRPFRPLQIAINAQYPNSMPRVIGGKHKSHQPESQATLRIVIAVDFDPTAGITRPKGTRKEDEDRLTVTDEMILDPRVEQAHASLLYLAKQTTDLSQYDVVEIFLEHRRPEKTSRTLFSTRSKEAWFVKYPIDPFAKAVEPAAPAPIAPG